MIILVGVTGGDINKDKDYKSLFEEPKNYNIIPFNYTQVLYNKFYPEYKEDMKIKVTNPEIENHRKELYRGMDKFMSNLIKDLKEKKMEIEMEAKGKILEPHQVRVVEEKEELDRKIYNLQKFIEDLTGRFTGLHPDEQTDMRNQLRTMEHYSDLLRRRINRF